MCARERELKIKESNRIVGAKTKRDTARLAQCHPREMWVTEINGATERRRIAR